MRRLTVTAAAVAAVATVGVGAGTAFATGTSTPGPTATATQGAGTQGTATAPARLAKLQARASAAVAKRVTALNKEIATVQAAQDLGTDQPALLKTLQADVSGLQALGQKIAGDSTVAVAAADYRTVFTNYRVFALALPVSRLVRAADRIDNMAIPKGTAAEGKLAAHVTPATSAQVTPLLDDIKAQLAAAGTATNGLSAQLINLTPATWNANHSVLQSPRTSVKAAVGDLKKAVADGKQARADLRAARPHHSTTTPAPGSTSTAA